MNRSVSSSLGESVHSLPDTMGGEDFLCSSPFNPKNLELRRKQREAKATKVAFQPQIFRVDSMAYRGRGIVEDSASVAPIASGPPRPRPRQPSFLANVSGSAERGSRRPPLPTHITDNGYQPHSHHDRQGGGENGAAGRRRGSEKTKANPYDYTAPIAEIVVEAPPGVAQAKPVVHIPAPPPAMSVSPSRRGTRPPASQPSSSSSSSALSSTRPPLSSTSLVNLSSPCSGAATSQNSSSASAAASGGLVISAPRSPAVPMDSPVVGPESGRAGVPAMSPLHRATMPPQSPANPKPDYFGSPLTPAGAAAAVEPSPPSAPSPPLLPRQLPRRAPAAPSRATNGVAAGARLPSAERDTAQEVRMRLVERLSLGSSGRPSGLPGDRRRKAEAVAFMAPLSPSSPVAVANAAIPQTSSALCVTVPSPAPPQPAALALPPLPQRQSSSDGQMTPGRAPHRNPSPPGIRRSSTVPPSSAQQTPARTRDAPASPSAKGQAADAATNASSSTAGTPLLGVRAKLSSGSGSGGVRDGTSDAPSSPATTAASTAVTTTPSMMDGVSEMRVTTRRTTQGRAGGSRRTVSSASPESAAASVPSESLSLPSSPSSATPVATPSATLRLMAGAAPPSQRITAATRRDIRASPSPAGFVFTQRPAACLPQPPPPPPPSAARRPSQQPEATTIPSPVKMRASMAPTTLAHQPPAVPALTAREQALLANEAANDAFMSKVRATQQRRTLADAARSSTCDSVRRQYYCLPLEEETSMPNFARRPGDLHFKTDQKRRTMDDETPNNDEDDAEGSVTDKKAITGGSKSPVVSATAPPLSPEQRGRETSAVRRDYYPDGTSPSTNGGSPGQMWSPDSERYWGRGRTVDASDEEDSEEEMEPLLLDAVQAFNARFA